MPIGQVMTGTAFFPGGAGLWNAPTNQHLPYGGVMVLGNTWGTREEIDCLFRAGGDLNVSPDGQNWSNAGPTWRGLLGLLQAAGIERTDCWFTNAYPGLIENPGSSSVSPTGSANLSPEGELEQFCQRFFLHTVEVMRPRLLLALGGEPIKFVGRLSEISSWQKMQSFAAIDIAGEARVDVDFAGVRMVAVALLHPCMRWANMRLRCHLPQAANGDREVELIRPSRRPTLSCVPILT